MRAARAGSAEAVLAESSRCPGRCGGPGQRWLSSVAEVVRLRSWRPPNRAKFSRIRLPGVSANQRPRTTTSHPYLANRPPYLANLTTLRRHRELRGLLHTWPRWARGGRGGRGAEWQRTGEGQRRKAARFDEIREG